MDPSELDRLADLAMQKGDPAPDPSDSYTPVKADEPKKKAPPVEQETLSEIDAQFITFVHQYYGLNNEFLTPETAFAEFGIPEDVYFSILKKDLVQKDLITNRGLPERELKKILLPEEFGKEDRPSEDSWVRALQEQSLTPVQLVVANTLLDLVDTRSHKKKLQDLNVSTAVYNEWLKDPIFAGYLRERAEAMLGEAHHEAHLALIDKVRMGDMNAIKYYNEMRNIYIEKSKQGESASNIDMQGIISRIIEIIQEEVDDLSTIRRIGERLGQLINAQTIAHQLTSPVGQDGRVLEQPKIAAARKMTPELEALVSRSEKSDV